MTTTSIADSWPGCHGVHVVGSGERLGVCRGEPLTHVEVKVGRPASPGPDELWSQPQPGGGSQRSTLSHDRNLVLELDGEPRVSLSPDRAAVTVAEPFGWVEAQLVASFIFPYMVSSERTLVLHAAAAERDGKAVLIAGPGGTGKSSSLIGLVDEGWTPLSEDVCTIDLAGQHPTVWPGPPWVRRRHGEQGPKQAPVLFESSEKTAWDIRGFRNAPGPTPVAELVILEPPLPGVPPKRTPLATGQTIGALAPHAVWLGDTRETGRRLFGPVAVAASRIPVSLLRLPVRDDWTDLLISMLG